MDRAIGFYRDVLGLEVKLESPHWSELVFGDSIIGLHLGGADEKTETGLSFQVSNIRSAFDETIAGGATEIEKPINREGEPIILAVIADTENNTIALTEYVG